MLRRKLLRRHNLTSFLRRTGKSENWNAWGNSMWPSVYLIDKRGYLRQFWPGELNWQGNNGEKYMREWIERLVADPNT